MRYAKFIIESSEIPDRVSVTVVISLATADEAGRASEIADAIERLMRIESPAIRVHVEPREPKRIRPRR